MKDVLKTSSLRRMFAGSGSLATKFLSINNEQCKTRLTFSDLNPVKLQYKLLMISLDKCNEICSSVDDLFTKNMCSKIVNPSMMIQYLCVTNVTSTASINSGDTKVRHKMDCCILCIALLVIVLLFMIAIICYHYLEHRSKQKHFEVLAI